MSLNARPTLPVEMLSEIVALAAFEADSRPELLSLCLASRVFHELSIRHLYRTVTIRCSDRSIADRSIEPNSKRPVFRSFQLCRTLLQSKYHVKEFVRSFTIEEAPCHTSAELISDVLSDLPHLESLCFDIQFQKCESGCDVLVLYPCRAGHRFEDPTKFLSKVTIPTLQNFKVEAEMVHSPTVTRILQRHAQSLHTVELSIGDIEEPANSLFFQCVVTWAYTLPGLGALASYAKEIHRAVSVLGASRSAGQPDLPNKVKETKRCLRLVGGQWAIRQLVLQYSGCSDGDSETKLLKVIAKSLKEFNFTALETLVIVTPVVFSGYLPLNHEEKMAVPQVLGGACPNLREMVWVVAASNREGSSWKLDRSVRTACAQATMFSDFFSDVLL
ncbi:uncharacterized protein STEHIDRAFT_141134 [Stereum hirsutum FP-91666 SS1]|uniref:uncharacterized protein n=1 Tax=Stereum hirsutum (strain FP-91666) TaxID=721885 RepID=UPI00044498A2|nr:uncharacterized protein STEHIDRAFT_141134 [Stereum hirsutum FP-91666 SS1]EIM83331.1 hypothetical protein STEHIDRAFT_141134 [Stereum hirsutum FP-91666 SS1]